MSLLMDSDVHAALNIHKRPEVLRDEFLDYMTFRTNRRPLFDEIFGPMIGLKEEWAAQGATPEELDFSAFRYRCPLRESLRIHTGARTGLQPQLLEETADYVITRDWLGRRTKRFKGVSSLSHPLDYPVRNADDWRRIRHWYAFHEDRFAPNWEREARAARARGASLQLSIPGGFDEPRQLMGEEAVCLAFYDQPELLMEILEALAQMILALLDRIPPSVGLDVLFVHEDMAGKSGPLAGPEQVQTFIAPYYRRIWQRAQSLGARLFLQDSDGDMRSVIPAFLDAGINAMLPLEPAAGMDIVTLRAQYGTQLAFWGGIDKYVLLESYDDIERELLYKVPFMVRSGGCILGLDHRIPNGVPLNNYRYYIRRMWELLEPARL